MTGSVLVLYKLSCPTDFKEEDFTTFMKDEVFPAVHRGPTRVGHVTELSLLQDHQSKAFVWAIEYSGFSEGADHAAAAGLQKLKSRGVEVSASLYDRVSSAIGDASDDLP